MCAPQAIQTATLTLRTAGRELDDITCQLSQLGHLIDAVDDRVDEHVPGDDAEGNARASAMLKATRLMLNLVRSSADNLVERMLHASEA